MGERYSSVHDGVLVAGVGPVAVGGWGSGIVVYTVVFSLLESGLSRWVGERFSGVHGGVLVAGVGPVAVGGGGAV